MAFTLLILTGGMPAAYEGVDLISALASLPEKSPSTPAAEPAVSSLTASRRLRPEVFFDVFIGFHLYFKNFSFIVSSMLSGLDENECNRARLP
jgi:hypothetical protein